ncbi:MAG: hypothetical protein O3B87_00835 [bacterium]|nr:hypothetical protein [bacterium]
MCAFLLFPSALHAQSYSLSLTPHTYHIIIKPGESATVPLEVTNSGDPLIIRLNPYMVQYANTSGTPMIIPYLSDNPNLPSITLGDTDAPISSPFLINTRDNIRADITITIPEQTPLGDYALAIVAEAEQTDGFQSSSVITLQGGTAARIIVSVSETGRLDAGGDVVQFDVSPNVKIPFWGKNITIVTRPSDMYFTMTLINTGMNVTRAYGTINEFEIPSTFFMSGQQRTLTFADELNDKWLGKVNAQAVVYFDTDPNPILTEVTFYILPLPLLLGAGAMLIIGLVMYMLSKYVKA